MIQYKILQYLILHPEITSNGIECNWNDSNYQRDRIYIFGYLKEIEKCMEWLDKIYVPSNREKDEMSSYSLKHYVEDYVGDYIPNGAFVTAVMMKNLKYKSVVNCPNVFIQLKPKILKYHKNLFNNYANRPLDITSSSNQIGGSL